MTSRRLTPVYEPAPTRAPDRSSEGVAVETLREGALETESGRLVQPVHARSQAPFVEVAVGADLAREGGLSPVSSGGSNGAAYVGMNGMTPVHRHVAAANVLLEPVRPGLERVEQRLRRAEARSEWRNSARQAATNAGQSTLFAPLANAFLNLIGSGGKRLRPALALLAAQVGLPPAAAAAMAEDERVISLAASVEMLHTSTLVHDDVIDGALLRRGAPTLNAHWSGGSTVLAGNYMFGTAAQLAAATGHMAVIHLFSDTLNVIVDGELRQLRDRYNYAQPRENYTQRIYAKTASLFCAATQGAALLAALPDDEVASLRDYGYHLGMAFQIVDDILDFTGDEDTLGKPAGSDMLQGTLTLPFFYYLRTLADPDALVEHLEQVRDGADDEHAEPWRAAVRAVVADLRVSPAIGEARREAQRSLDAARAALVPFPSGPIKSTMLALCDFVLQRTH